MKKVLALTIILFICLVFYYLWDSKRVIKSDYQKTIDIIDECIKKSSSDDYDETYYIDAYSNDDDKKIITIYMSINSKENQDRILNLKGINKKYITFEQKPVDKTYKHLVIGEESNIEKNSDYISIKGKVKNTGLTLLLKNTSDHTLYYGQDYYIEILIDNKWYKIVAFDTWNSILYSLNSGEDKEIEVRWKSTYGKLEPATYRIVKPYNDSLAESFHRYLTVEFTVK